MSKTSSKGKDKGEELLSITPKKSAKLTVIDTTQNPTPATSIVEESDIVTISGVQVSETIKEPVVEVNLVYELVFMEDKKEKTIYTKLNPQFSAKHILRVEEAFGKEDLKEVVLGRKEVKACCRKPLDQEVFDLDLRKATLIKVLEEQPWMNAEFESTKRAFDESVLKAYRELSTVPAPPPVQGIPASKTPIKQGVKQTAASETVVRPGNIPIDKNRPQINNF